ncbi:hypothetical protein DUI87_33951 [Hirundo rustica rustica]|uniref:Uncharacterized protein n=1 Tax=Hirundo rustica rustica TaxID=333673 RepID=A0A3M0IL15_HIRRU|nr:hypothetical protein DUI87_33951 [Hirundo rustica rustica]
MAAAGGGGAAVAAPPRGIRAWLRSAFRFATDRNDFRGSEPGRGSGWGRDRGRDRNSGPRGFFYYPYTHLCGRAEQLRDKDATTSITQDTTNQGTRQQQKPLRKKNDREDRENSEGDDKRNNNQDELARLTEPCGKTVVTR